MCWTARLAREIACVGRARQNGRERSSCAAPIVWSARTCHAVPSVTDDFPPLRRVSRPVPLDAYDETPLGLIRLFFAAAGGAPDPAGGIATVSVRSRPTRSSSLSPSARLRGSIPTAASRRRSPSRRPDCLAIRLAGGLSDRVVRDDATGQPVRRLGADPARRDDDALFVRAAAERGCPVWPLEEPLSYMTGDPGANRSQ